MIQAALTAARAWRAAALSSLCLVAALASNTAWSQSANGNIWRCDVAGKVTYSTTPCPNTRGGKALEAQEPRNAQDVREAQQRAARDRQALAARGNQPVAMQTQAANLGPERAKPMPPQAEKPPLRADRRSHRKTHRVKKALPGETWRAVVPGSRRKKG